MAEKVPPQGQGFLSCQTRSRSPNLNIPTIFFAAPGASGPLYRARPSPVPAAGDCKAGQPWGLCKHQALLAAGVLGSPPARRGQTLPHAALGSPDLFRGHRFSALPTLRAPRLLLDLQTLPSIPCQPAPLRYLSPSPYPLAWPKNHLVFILAFPMYPSAERADTAPPTQAPRNESSQEHQG